ncbi:hypothetical protein CHELA1G11_30090 [Hyphomicrobiales bacterium]|nr:hypothetical protein CHELA1G2_30130 [Hyphomicrobiales bacterium]CAH1696198.1 hypothetical protein CHELA1G11_30090 [Hyphomicrobiales bacterium]
MLSNTYVNTLLFGVYPYICLDLALRLCRRTAGSHYWRSALDKLTTLAFTLDRATWDPVRRELNVIYEADLNGQRRRACEQKLAAWSKRRFAARSRPLRCSGA